MSIAKLKGLGESYLESEKVVEDLKVRVVRITSALDEHHELDVADKEALAVILGGITVMIEAIEHSDYESIGEMKRDGMLQTARDTINRIDAILA